MENCERWSVQKVKTKNYKKSIKTTSGHLCEVVKPLEHTASDCGETDQTCYQTRGRHYIQEQGPVS